MSSTFCPLLFQHLATHPDGGVTHCCVSDHAHQASNAYDLNCDGTKRIYNVNRDSLTSLYNSDSFRSARLKSLTGENIAACSRCFAEERAGETSKRQIEIGNYPDFTIDRAREITEVDGSIIDPQFEFIELRLGNTCNVKCRTCNPASSSKWRDEYKTLETSLDFITRYNNLDGFQWTEQEHFWEDLKAHSKNVKVFYINGGEPMLIKKHFQFLERLVKTNNTDVVLWYNTNMTIMNQKVLDLWKHFRKVIISASIDDLGARNHYIRYPTDWNDVERNLHLLQSLDWISLSITQTVSFMNYASLSAFYDYFEIQRGLSVYHNITHDPAFLSPRVLPRHIIMDAQTSFTTMPETIQHKLREAAGSQQDLLGWKKAITYTNAVDQLRKQDIIVSLPEFRNNFK